MLWLALLAHVHIWERIQDLCFVWMGVPREVILPGVSSRGYSCARRFMELIIFGAKSERVALNNGPSGCKG